MLYSILARRSVPGPQSIPWRSRSTERCKNREPKRLVAAHVLAIAGGNEETRQRRVINGALRTPTVPTVSASFSPAVADGSDKASAKRGRSYSPRTPAP
jgi:hypothetical protein